MNDTGCRDNAIPLNKFVLSRQAQKSCRAQKNFGVKSGNVRHLLPPGKLGMLISLITSIRLAAAPEDTPALVKGLHLTPLAPQPSGSDLLRPILVMKATENRLGCHSISRGNLMSFAAAQAVRLPAPEAPVPGSHGALPDNKWVFQSVRIPLRCRSLMGMRRSRQSRRRLPTGRSQCELA